MSDKIGQHYQQNNNSQQEVEKQQGPVAPAGEVEHVPNFGEVGTTGLKRFGQHVYDEFLPQLRWPRAARIYREMESNDPVVGAILHVTEQLLRQVRWHVEAGGDTQADEEAKWFLESCMDDMSTTWEDTMAEILTMIPYGFAWHEEVYKIRDGDNRDPRRRSKHTDGRIGWRKIPGRAQETIEGWVFDDENNDGGIRAAMQIAPPDYRRRVIPIEKSLLFRVKYRYNNPEGRSLLRNAYRPWYFKKHIEEIEGIGIERDLAGLPVITPPEHVDIWNPNDPQARQYRQQAEYLVQNVRRDQNEGIVKPYGWEFELLSTGSRRQFDTNQIINRYDQRIAMTMLADLVMMGADKVGSFALAEAKQGLLAASLESIADSIAEVFNRYAIPRLFKLNVFPGITDYPKLRHSKVVGPDLNELARFVQAAAGAEMPLFPDINLEEYLRDVAGLPSAQNQSADEREQALERIIEQRLQQQQGDEHGNNTTGLNNPPGDGRTMNQGEPQETR